MGRVNVRIDESEKDEIERYVQENKEYSSISHFLRLAANKEMNGDEEGQGNEIPPHITRTLDKILGELEELKEGIDGIAVQLDSDGQDIEALAREVYETIPAAPVATQAEMAASRKSAHQLERQHIQPLIGDDSVPTTIPALARRLNADREDIKEAIRHLKSEFLPILEVVDEDGTKHFFIQEDRR
ncbi:MAG: hypothetical protein ABEI11_03695 [Haloarculaceae archaeon]